MHDLRALFVVLLHSVIVVSALPKVIYSVNCGGEHVVDSSGTAFQADRLADGIASDFGAKHDFREVVDQDKLLYQTERYSLDSFTYTTLVDARDNDQYTLLFKFAEVYFRQPNEKVFSVLLNGHSILPSVDIFKSAHGIGRPYDVQVSFAVEDGSLLVDDLIIEFDGTLEITFAKGELDNPKCNAFALFKGQGAIPETRKAKNTQIEMDQEMEARLSQMRQEMEDRSESASEKYGSGPRVDDPYDSQDAMESLWPFFVGIPALVIPTVLLLYKMK